MADRIMGPSTVSAPAAAAASWKASEHSSTPVIPGLTQ